GGARQLLGPLPQLPGRGAQLERAGVDGRLEPPCNGRRLALERLRGRRQVAERRLRLAPQRLDVAQALGSLLRELPDRGRDVVARALHRERGAADAVGGPRSEERRVGKQCGSRWALYQQAKKQQLRADNV